MVKKKGDKWVLMSKDGKKVLGTFATKEAALKREKQIMGFKNQRGKR